MIFIHVKNPFPELALHLLPTEWHLTLEGDGDQEPVENVSRLVLCHFSLFDERLALHLPTAL